MLEHAVSDEVLNRIDEILGHPERDPHGSPIPTSAGEFNATETVALDRVEVGARGIVVEIPDNDPGLLRHLARLGLAPGTRFEALDILRIDGTRILKCAAREISVSPGIAATVQVSLDK